MPSAAEKMRRTCGRRRRGGSGRSRAAGDGGGEARWAGRGTPSSPPVASHLSWNQVQHMICARAAAAAELRCRARRPQPAALQERGGVRAARGRGRRLRLQNGAGYHRALGVRAHTNLPAATRSVLPVRPSAPSARGSRAAVVGPHRAQGWPQRAARSVKLSDAQLSGSAGLGAPWTRRRRWHSMNEPCPCTPTRASTRQPLGRSSRSAAGSGLLNRLLSTGSSSCPSLPTLVRRAALSPREV